MVKKGVIKETFEYSPEGVRQVDGRMLSRWRRASLKVLSEAKASGQILNTQRRKTAAVDGWCQVKETFG